ncbi:MAG: DsbC family protein [Geobacteraceae bacterium]|nr:DsbC family protein [Geobacteraceae bacterium]
MKKPYLFAICCMSLLLAAGTSVQAAPQNKGPREALHRLYPNIKVTSMTKTDIEGLYEVMSDGKIAYFHPKTGYLILGNIITSQGRNLTQERVGTEMYKSLDPHDLKKAIKIGTGKNVVIEVSDPDCPYCRKMHAFWNTRSDVTRYIFLAPLDMHPDAVKKATYILASADVEKALFEAYSGQLDNNRQLLDKKYDDKGRLQEQKAVVEKLKVDSTPVFWVNGTYVVGANKPLIEKLLNKSVHSK